MDYKKLYAMLLSEVDKALSMMENQDNFRAYQTLLNACNLCEEEYIDQAESSPITPELLLRILGYCTANRDAEAYNALHRELGYILEIWPPHIKMQMVPAAARSGRPTVRFLNLYEFL